MPKILASICKFLGSLSMHCFIWGKHGNSDWDRPRQCSISFLDHCVNSLHQTFVGFTVPSLFSAISRLWLSKPHFQELLSALPAIWLCHLPSSPSSLMFKVLWVLATDWRQWVALLRLIYVSTLTQETMIWSQWLLLHSQYTLVLSVTLKLALLWAGSQSRTPSRHPFPTYSFLGLTKEAGLMTVQNQQNTYIYGQIDNR